MDTNISRLVNSLESNEVKALLNLYYNKDGITNKINLSDFKNETIQGLIDKKLIASNISLDNDNLSLTSDGLSVCGSVMFQKIKENSEIFKEKMKKLPERAIATIIKRIMWKDTTSKESGLADQIIKSYDLEESVWYERVLLNDERIVNVLNVLYNILENVGFVKKINGEDWCSPEVENFLKEEYKNLMDLTWLEEDSLKYYFFYYVYAQGQKNLINFAGEGTEYRSMFFNEDSNTSNYWYKINNTEPRTLLTSLGLSEKRIISFLNEMEKKDIVSERYYPISSFTFLNEEDKIFVIKDIKKYMDFIEKKFLKHVVDSILE